MSPPVTDGLARHYDASELTLADSDPVGTWPNLGSQGSSWDVAASGDARPLFDADTDAVVFDGSNDRLVRVGISADAIAQPNTVFVVAQSATTSGDRHVFDGDGSSSNRNFLRLSGSDWLAFAGPPGITVSPADTDLHVFGALFNGASSWLRVDGAQTAGEVTASRSHQGQSIGGQHGGGNHWQGSVHEVLFYSRALTAQEVSDTEDYLTAKWLGGGGTQDESGGSVASVSATGTGAGTATEDAQGGAHATVTAAATGAGTGAEDASGGATASVSASATGQGTAAEHASGGSTTTVTAAATGGGQASGQHETGGSTATVSTAATGQGTAAEHPSGGSTATVTVTATGAGVGPQTETGGSTATVGVSATGAGQATETATGGATAVVSVTATGGGGDPSIVVVAPPERTLTIAAEDRTLHIAAEDRTLVVPAEDRTLIVRQP